MWSEARLEEFDLRVKQVKYHNKENSYTVFEATVLIWRPIKKEWSETGQKIICVGYFYNLIENDHYHVNAEEFEDDQYGPQYQIYASERVQPGTEHELKKFLMSITGVGSTIANKIVNELGISAITDILNDCSILNRIRIPQKAKSGLYEAIVENQYFEQLLLFLQLHGIPPKHTTKVFEKYGDYAIEKIRTNPYSLYMDEVIDFKTADCLNLALEGKFDGYHRVTAGVLAFLRSDSESNGNLYISRDVLCSQVNQFLSKSSGLQEITISEGILEKSIKSLLDDRHIIVDGNVADAPVIYLANNYFAERKVAKRVYEISRGIKYFYAREEDIQIAISKTERRYSFTLAPEQKAAIIAALTSPISILTGGPGTGKTQTLTMLIKTISEIKPSASIRLCAPTGKAATRMSELTGRHASTIHRMIGYPNTMLQTDELNCDFLICDESSMSDVQLCAWMFDCANTGARILLVGDHEQLPSVGPGLVLRDLIQSECIPVTTLKTVFRQASQSNIVSNAHTIVRCPINEDVPLAYSECEGGDFYFIEAATQSKVIRLVQKSVLKMLHEGFPLDQIEVLSPIHASLIGTENINRTLQEWLNPNGIGYQLKRGIELKVKDKVIHTKNDYDLGIFNGETGTVAEITFNPQKAVLVDYKGKMVWYNSEQAENLDLSYAITTHRSQGSEFQAVIIIVHDSLAFNLNRNALYTALTRAKKRVVFIGSEKALQIGLRKVDSVQRNSNLIGRLRNEFKM